MIDKDKALTLRLLGKTYQEIADIAGVSKQRIHQFLTGYKSPSRERLEKVYEKRFRHTEKGRERQRKAQTRIRAKAKVLVLTHYGGGKCACVKCGFHDIRALSIDHLKATGTKHKKENKIRSGDGIYRLLLKQSFPLGYQTLCMNCQWIKRVENNECHRIQ